MDDMKAFERQLAAKVVRMAGPDPQVNALQVARTAATQSPRWRFRPTFSATKVVVAGVILALFGGLLAIARPFDEQAASVPGAATSGPGTFSPAGSLNEPRFQHTSTLLSDGRVLVVGGLMHDQRTVVGPAEIWDPATSTFETTGSLAQGRAAPTATRLDDGRVLIVGGDDNVDCFVSAEIWDPATGSFGPAGSLAQIGCRNHAPILLPDGRVLFVGGSDSGENRIFAEIWDPATETFAPAGSLEVAFDGVAASLLSDGRVLVLAASPGDEDDFDGHTSAHYWDPETASFSPAGEMDQAPAYWIRALPLPDGRVLMIETGHDSGFLAQVWDPTSESFIAAGTFEDASIDTAESVTGLPDGRVLIVGSISGEILDPVTGSIDRVGLFDDARTRMIHSATLLDDGRVLITGGGSAIGLVEAAEVWAPGGG